MIHRWRARLRGVRGVPVVLSVATDDQEVVRRVESAAAAHAVVLGQRLTPPDDGWPSERSQAGLSIPGYWMNETSGVLAPAVEAYLLGEELTLEQIGAMRAYLRQWIDAPWLDLTGRLLPLRLKIDSIRTTAGLRAWLADALDLGVDPL